MLALEPFVRPKLRRPHILGARSDLGSHMGLVPWTHPPGDLWKGPLSASRNFLTLLFLLLDPLLRMPGGGDTENGEKLKVGGTSLGRTHGT